MLKIKDTVDLKELEKFGFKEETIYKKTIGYENQYLNFYTVDGKEHEKLEEKLYDYKYSIHYVNKNGRYCTVEVIENTIGQLIGEGEYGKIYEGMKLYDEYEEENCIPEYDDEECCFRLVYTSNYSERIENLDGLIPIEEGE